MYPIKVFYIVAENALAVFVGVKYEFLYKTEDLFGFGLWEWIERWNLIKINKYVSSFFGLITAIQTSGSHCQSQTSLLVVDQPSSHHRLSSMSHPVAILRMRTERVAIRSWCSAVAILKTERVANLMSWKLVDQTIQMIGQVAILRS